jgi:integrase/recombinase XerD
MTISEAFEVRIIALMAEGKKEKTFKNYRCAYHSLVSATGDIPITLFGHQQLAVWHLYLKQNGASDSYIRGNYQLLKSVLGYLLDSDIKVMEPRKIKAPKRDTVPKIPLTTQEVRDLIEAAKNPRDKAIVATVFLTAGRISEVLSIDKESLLRAPLDDKGRQEIMVCGKNGKYKPLFVYPATRTYIDTYLNTRRHPVTQELDKYPPLFMSGQCRRITVNRVEQIMHEAARSAGLEKRVTPHLLRHSKTTDLLENGAPIELVSKMLGHSSVAITSKVYSHVGTAAQKDMVDAYSTPI